MFSKKFEEKKAVVLDIYERYMSFREEFQGKHEDGVAISTLEERVEQLKNGKFVLAVVGEVSAGKSTFINALLGEQVLPTDVLQSSSALVEVFKSDEKLIKTVFANGNEEIITNDNSETTIDSYLKSIASVNEKYRRIPFIRLNEFLIETEGKYDQESKNHLINQLKQEHNFVSEQDFEELIEEYLAEHNNLDRIPVKVEFGYPLSYELDALRLIDSPGVNAIGGIQDLTLQYINEANAILYIHSIKPVESESFCRFFEKTISDRSQDAVFLILTHAASLEEAELFKLHQEAKIIYNKIPEERILYVDSIVEMINHDLKKGYTLEQIKKESKKKRKLINWLYDEADDDEEKFHNLLEKFGFNTLKDELEEFVARFPDIQLAEVAKSIKTGYENQRNSCEQRIELLKRKKKSPQEFRNEINRIHGVLNKYRILLHEFSEQTRQQYSGIHASWNKQLDAVKTDFPWKIIDVQHLEEVNKVFEDANEALHQIIKDTLDNLTTTFSLEMREIGKTFEEDENTFVPIVDTSSIKREAERESFKEISHVKFVPTLKFWRMLRKVKTQVFDLDSYKTKLQAKFRDNMEDIRRNTSRMVDFYCNKVIGEITFLIGAHKEELEMLKNKEQKNDDVIRDIESSKYYQKNIEKQQVELETILENLQ